MDDEQPPEDRRPQTPAERAGATPLDPSRLRANLGTPMAQRQREIDAQVAAQRAEEGAPPVVRRRRNTAPALGAPAPRRAPWFLMALVAALAGLAVLAAGLLSESDVAVATGASPELVATTPVLSPRRTPELLARPVARRNLNADVAPVLETAPPDTCLQVREGANVLIEQLPTTPVIPASNMKLVTGAATLALLDPQSRLTTRFLTDGTPTDGTVVKGNLYMVGGGDPLLSTDDYLAGLPNGRQPATDMATVADQIAGTGIREITGSVIGDESRYDAQRGVDAWPERFTTQGQVAPLSALLVDDARSPGQSTSLAPAVQAAAVLTELLEDRGVEISGEPGAGTAPEGAAQLTEVESLPIADIVDEGLRFSDNTTMELLVKEIGLQVGGEGTTATGLQAIREWSLGAGLPVEGLIIDDGSGLSEQDRATCAMLSALLEDDGAQGTIAEGLARPGEPGTLDDRLDSETLTGRVRAKTGTLRPVTALSGWLRTVPERDLGFSFIINTPDRQVTDADTALQDELLNAMLDYPRTPPVEQLVPAPPSPPGA